MRKILLSIFVIAFSVTNSFSQGNTLVPLGKPVVVDTKGYLALSIGLCIPTGDFAIKDIKIPAAGLANTGVMYDLSFAYRFEKKFGIAISLREQVNPLDNENIASQFRSQIPGAQWTVESKNWVTVGFMFGGYFSLPIGNGNTSFEIKEMIGFVNVTSPEMTITGTANGVSEWELLKGNTATSFSYLFGAGFKFNLGSTVCLLTGFDLSGTKPGFENSTTTSNFGYYSSNSFVQSIGAFNLTAGLGLRF